jgi:quercetin dioxygenase-like cupin family protein
LRALNIFAIIWCRRGAMHLLKTNIDYSDSRGIISDLVVDELNSATLVTFEVGAVRGNHVHHQTTQWKFIISGSLVLATLSKSGELVEHVGKMGELWVCYPGEPHAMRALEKTSILVLTKGPRAGKDYDSDTEKISIF